MRPGEALRELLGTARRGQRTARALQPRGQTLVALPQIPHRRGGDGGGRAWPERVFPLPPLAAGRAARRGGNGRAHTDADAHTDPNAYTDPHAHAVADPDPDADLDQL